MVTPAAAATIKLLWMVIYIGGDVAGVFLNEPMPSYMTMKQCEISAEMHTAAPDSRRRGAKYVCERHYGQPLKTGRFWRRME